MILPLDSRNFLEIFLKKLSRYASLPYPLRVMNNIQETKQAKKTIALIEFFEKLGNSF